MAFYQVDEFINNKIDWGENKALQLQYPYFSIPFLAEWMASEDADKNIKDVSRFNANVVLLADLEKKFSETVSSPHDADNSTDDSINIETYASQDYYSSQGIKISDHLPEIQELEGLNSFAELQSESSSYVQFDEKSLLIQMSFNEWLTLITSKKKNEIEEQKEQEDLKNNWKKRKLTEAIEEESDDIPEEVFKMAVDSIEKDDVVSESIAEVYILQSKYEQAINIYKKLILQNPEKKVYFATKIDTIRNNYNL